MSKVISSLVAFLSISVLCAQPLLVEVPKLVVGITIDQLRGDYLKLFRYIYGDRGFNRLLDEGLVYNNIRYDFPYLDKASTIATIYTGAYPSYHGITAENRYLVETHQVVSSFADNNYMGDFTSEMLSPLPLKVSTIADELKIASDGQSDVYAFAPDASQAIVSGGHAANAAYWIENENGKWATTTFYKSKHHLVEQHNRSQQSLTYTIGSTTWRPEIDIEYYYAFPYTRNRYNFQHYLGNKEGNSFRLFKESPYVNKEVNDMAIRLLESGTLGKRVNPDFLALTFYAGGFSEALDKNYSLEIQDTYYRLDLELARLLDAIERAVGIENCLIFVASTGYFNEQEVIPEGMTTSGGEFFPERSQALLNMYLMALYGRVQWVKTYFNEQIFFDRKLIEESGFNLKEFQQEAAEFLVQSAGVQDVITSHQMLHGAYNQNVQLYRNGYYEGISGDLLLELQPGWKVVDDRMETSDRGHCNAIMAPVIFFGNHVKPGKVNRTIDATEIAPTIAYRLRIRAPNAAKAEILEEFYMER
ncbi:MAG: alkaline phosphatase family protein [Fermentimonas sp.]